MKQVLFFVVIFFVPVFLFSQQVDSSAIRQDTLIQHTVIRDTVVQDSIKKVATHDKHYNNRLAAILSNNKILNADGKAVATSHILSKQNDHQTIYFYLITGLTLFLAFFKFFYAKYFNNLFRVFFNTSLRQSQLTDQLLQAKLPSLFFNLFFVMSGGLYLYLLLDHFNWVTEKKLLTGILICILLVAVVYFTKYLTLKFTGWLTGYTQSINMYVFVTFLINKVLGIFLIPCIIVMAFSEKALVKPVIFISLSLVILMLLLRYIRAYGLLQNKLKVSRLHFFLYIIGIEIIPLLLIYKGLMILLNKNL
ncbi:MAG: DUF4271 domain-containing protein [Bacteroidota bacterium]